MLLVVFGPISADPFGQVDASDEIIVIWCIVAFKLTAKRFERVMIGLSCLNDIDCRHVGAVVVFEVKDRKPSWV